MPVNGYKMADKLIEANKSLFEEDNAAAVAADGDAEPATETIERRNGGPRVTFSSDIEEYEDESSDIEAEQMNERNDDDLADVTDETQPIETSNENDAAETMEEVIEEDPSIAGVANETANENIEEICDDIDAMKMDPVDNETEIVEEINEQIDGAQPVEKNDEIRDEQKKESVPEKMDTIETQVDEVSQETVIENVPAPQKPVHQCTPSNKPRTSVSARTSNSNKQPKTLPKARKAISNPSSRKSSLTASPKTNDKIDQHDSDELLRIRLNFKCCCEHKYEEVNRLPRYRGYFSQYGLSKEELEERAERKVYIRQMRYENWLRRNEEREMKALLNEHAYSQWLTGKLKNVRQKDKNMYDYDVHNKRLPKKVYKGVIHAECWKY